MATKKSAKKYKLLKSDTKPSPDGKTLFRVEALVDFSIFKKGDKGGYVEKEANLSQKGDAWVSSDARVYGNAQVSGDAQVYGYALVYGNAYVSGNAQVSGDALVYGNAGVSGNARVYGDAQVSGDALVYGNALVSGDAQVSGDAWVSGRFDLLVSIDFELPRITIDTKEKLEELRKFLEEF